MIAIPSFVFPASPLSITKSNARTRQQVRPNHRPFKTFHRDRITVCIPTPPESPNTILQQPTPLVSDETIQVILRDTMLTNESLGLAYTSDKDGFDNATFFDKLVPLGGVPSLILGQTSAGVCFGGYAASGFLARDDYREATNPRSMFVFRIIENGQVMFAEPTDLVQYDFYDYAIRLGAALLGIPMNPDKHIMKADVGTSSCRLPNGETSVFGDSTLSKIRLLQVWVADKYLQEIREKSSVEQKGFFARLFG